MAEPGDTPLYELEERTARRDPRFAHDPGAGRPRRPRRPPRSRRYRRAVAWSLLVVSLSMQVAGMLLPEGLLLAAGLVMAGTVTRLFVTPHGHRPDRLWPRLPLRPQGDDGRR